MCIRSRVSFPCDRSLKSIVSHPNQLHNKFEAVKRDLFASLSDTSSIRDRISYSFNLRRIQDRHRLSLSTVIQLHSSDRSQFSFYTSWSIRSTSTWSPFSLITSLSSILERILVQSDHRASHKPTNCWLGWHIIEVCQRQFFSINALYSKCRVNRQRPFRISLTTFSARDRIKSFSKIACCHLRISLSQTRFDDDVKMWNSF